MQTTPLAIEDVLLVTPDVHGDSRGYFYETWQSQRYAEVGVPGVFVQDNVSFSQGPVLRGLHLQHPHGQAKLIQVLVGEVFDVAVDIRRGAPTFGRWVGAVLSATNHHQLFIPAGFAHGFCCLSNEVLFAYKCSDYYDPRSELSVRWNDPSIGIEWPIAGPKVSDKDANAPLLADIPTARLPSYDGR